MFLALWLNCQPMEPQWYEFTAPLVKKDFEVGFVHQMIIVPDAVLDQLGNPKRIRIKGFLNDTPFNLAIQNTKEGLRYLMIGAPLMKQCKLRVGYMVKVRFFVPDQSEIELPEELVEVLAQDEAAGKKFYAMTPGRQRSLAHYVTTAKTVDTRIKRALELAHKIVTDTLYGQVRAQREAE